MKLSPFVLGVLVFCGLIAAVAVLTFSGALPGFRSEKVGLSGTVVVWGAADFEVIKIPLDRLNFANSDQFSLSYVQKDAATLDQELTEALAEGRGPDLVVLPQDLLRRHLNKIEPISYEVFTEQNFRQTFIPAGDLFLNDQGVIALPWYVDPLVLYYNDQILTSAGIPLPPRYWADIQSPLSTGILKRVTLLDERNNISQSAIALGQFNNLNHAKDILSLLIMQSGDQIVTGPLGANKVVFDRGVQAALNFFIQFSDPTKEQYTWNSALPRSIDMFTAGKLAFYLGRASDLALIRKANPHLPFNVVKVPQIDNRVAPQTFGQLYGIAVLKASKKKPAATAAAIAFTGNSFALGMDEKNPLPSARRDLLEQVGADNIKNVFRQSALISRGWLDPNPIETNQIFKDMVENLLVGRLPVSDAVFRARDRLLLIK